MSDKEANESLNSSKLKTEDEAIIQEIENSFKPWNEVFDFFHEKDRS